VEVAGETVSPSADGHFTVPLTLKEGRNTVSVRAVSVSGGKQEESRDVLLDTTPPKLGLDQDIWK
jgi:hypothetical protein